MRRLMLAFGLLVASIPTANAEEQIARPAAQVARVGPTVSLELIDAHREYQLAKLRMYEHRFVTLPRQRRQLDDRVKLAEQEIAVLKRRLRDYRPFLLVGEYSAVRTVAESHRLMLLATEQRLRRLKDEQIALMRLTRQQNQLDQLDLLRATTRMALARAELGRAE